MLGTCSSLQQCYGLWETLLWYMALVVLCGLLPSSVQFRRVLCSGGADCGVPCSMWHYRSTCYYMPSNTWYLVLLGTLNLLLASLCRGVADCGCDKWQGVPHCSSTSLHHHHLLHFGHEWCQKQWLLSLWSFLAYWSQKSFAWYFCGFDIHLANINPSFILLVLTETLFCVLYSLSSLEKFQCLAVGVSGLCHSVYVWLVFSILYLYLYVYLCLCFIVWILLKSCQCLAVGVSGLCHSVYVWLPRGCQRQNPQKEYSSTNHPMITMQPCIVHYCPV